MKTQIPIDFLTEEMDVWLKVVSSIALDLQVNFVENDNLDLDTIKESSRLIEELYGLHVRINAIVHEIKFRHTVGLMEILGEPLPYSNIKP